MSSLFVPTHMASDFTLRPTPEGPLPSSTWPFTPTAPMRIEISVGMDFPSFWCSVSSPEPAPASAHAETCRLRSTRA